MMGNSWHGPAIRLTSVDEVNEKGALIFFASARTLFGPSPLIGPRSRPVW
jgi:hypothetical protein